jgi:hypothetical protein
MPRSPLYPEYPSVTELLRAVGLTRAFPEFKAVRDAQARGTALHCAIHLLHKGTLDEATVHPTIRPFFDAYQRFVAETGHVVEEAELELVSDKLGVIGHLDQVSRKGAIWDLKTGDDPDLFGARLQLGGYELLYQERYNGASAGRYVLNLRKNGTYRVYDLTDDYALTVFRSAQILYTVRREEGLL